MQKSTKNMSFSSMITYILIITINHDDDMLQPLPWAISSVQQWAAPSSLLLASPTPPPCCRWTPPPSCSCSFKFTLSLQSFSHILTNCQHVAGVGSGRAGSRLGCSRALLQAVPGIHKIDLIALELNLQQFEGCCLSLLQAFPRIHKLGIKLATVWREGCCLFLISLTGSPTNTHDWANCLLGVPSDKLRKDITRKRTLTFGHPGPLFSDIKNNVLMMMMMMLAMIIMMVIFLIMMTKVTKNIITVKLE